MSATVTTPFKHGIVLPEHNYTTMTHFNAATRRSPLATKGIPVTMHELSHGKPHPSSPPSSSSLATSPLPSDVSFGGQFGIIDFDTSTRLPRHVHISGERFTTERILVLDGTALVELNGRIYVIPPRTLVTISPGVPHTWTACPKGLDISEAVELRGRQAGNGSENSLAGERPETEAGRLVSEGWFTMIYEYEEVTGFFPTAQTETLKDFEEYKVYEDLESIRFPVLSVEEVKDRACFMWGSDVWITKG